MLGGGRGFPDNPCGSNPAIYGDDAIWRVYLRRQVCRLGIGNRFYYHQVTSPDRFQLLDRPLRAIVVDGQGLQSTTQLGHAL